MSNRKLSMATRKLRYALYVEHIFGHRPRYVHPGCVYCQRYNAGMRAYFAGKGGNWDQYMAKRFKDRSLEDMAAELYDDKEVAAAVIAHADELGNRERIERGEMALPTPQDATTWFEREGSSQKAGKDAKRDTRKGGGK